jgi:ABC-type branched-subunit amino acid transport system substrate-binding protein
LSARAQAVLAEQLKLQRVYVLDDADDLTVATNDLSRAALPLPLTPAARRFEGDLGQASTQLLGVLEAGQAAELVLQAIARSDGSRASVLRELRASKVKDGLLGTFAFDRNGDNTAALVPIVRITGTASPDPGFPDAFRGAVLDRVVEAPASLVR